MKNIFSKVLSSLTIVTLVFSSFGLALTAQAVDLDTNNPSLGESCGLDIALVMDSSGSIDNGELSDMKDAFDGFVDALLPSTPTLFSVVDFDSSATLTQDFTSDAGSLHSAIAAATSGGSTNWEDGLVKAQDAFDPRDDHPNLVIFASDGNPTVNNDNSNNSSQTDPDDLSRAVTVADSIKVDDGTRIITIGIGNDLDTANLEAISGPGAVYSSGFDTLAADLASIATELCGGTINVHKVIDRDGNLETTDDQSAGEGWDFTVAGTPETTDGSGNTQSVVVANAGPWSVVETPKSGYSFITAQCTKDSGQTVVGTLGDGAVVNDISLTEQDIVSCTFYNKPGSVGLTVIKNVVNDSDTGTSVAGDFTLDVSMATDSQAVPFDSVSFPGVSGEGSSIELPGDTYYVVGEQNPGNYSVSFSADCSGTIGVGEAKVCTVTNDDLPPNVGSLTVVKVVINDDDGISEVSDFPLWVNGDMSVTSGQANILSPGEYSVSETDDTDDYNATFSGDCDSNGNVTLSAGESKTCVITNDDKDQTPPIKKKSHHSGGGHGSSQPAGEVLGAQDVCSFAIDTYMRKGHKNNADQVKVLQGQVLNVLMNAGLVVDGVYGSKTEAAVKAFQMKYKADILDPWGIVNPTGIFYKTTLVKAKNLICPVTILPIPKDLINWSENPEVAHQ